MTPTPITDNLLRVVGPERHASAPRGKAGGEWDAWYALPLRARRRLIGARWAAKGEMPPDVLADVIIRNGAADNYRDALEWYYRNALLAVDERRRSHRNDSRARAAAAAGARSYYHLRDMRAVLDGHASFWHQRKARRVANGQPATEPRTRHRRWVPEPIMNRIERRREAYRRAMTTRENHTCRPTQIHDSDERRHDQRECVLAPTGTDVASSPPPPS